jgi:hypothetical protein
VSVRGFGSSIACDQSGEFFFILQLYFYLNIEDIHKLVHVLEKYKLGLLRPHHTRRQQSVCGANYRLRLKIQKSASLHPCVVPKHRTRLEFVEQMIYIAYDPLHFTIAHAFSND